MPPQTTQTATPVTSSTSAQVISTIAKESMLPQASGTVADCFQYRNAVDLSQESAVNVTSNDCSYVASLYQVTVGNLTTWTRAWMRSTASSRKATHIACKKLMLPTVSDTRSDSRKRMVSADVLQLLRDSPNCQASVMPRAAIPWTVLTRLARASSTCTAMVPVVSSSTLPIACHRTSF